MPGTCFVRVPRTNPLLCSCTFGACAPRSTSSVSCCRHTHENPMRVVSSSRIKLFQGQWLRPSSSTSGSPGPLLAVYLQVPAPQTPAIQSKSPPFQDSIRFSLSICSTASLQTARLAESPPKPGELAGTGNNSTPPPVTTKTASTATDATPRR